jgi:hypothetical protein
MFGLRFYNVDFILSENLDDKERVFGYPLWPITDYHLQQFNILVAISKPSLGQPLDLPIPFSPNFHFNS